MPQHLYQWHPIFVHFTIALLAISVVFFGLAWRIRSGEWHARLVHAAELDLWTGTALTTITAAFGWIAFETVPHDDGVHELMVRHRDFALATFAGFIVLTAASIWQRRRPGYPSLLFAAGLVTCLAILAATGLLGGQLVYEHGLAVERPTTVAPLTVAPSDEKPATAAPVERPTQRSEQPHHHHDHPHK